MNQNSIWVQREALTFLDLFNYLETVLILLTQGFLQVNDRVSTRLFTDNSNIISKIVRNLIRIFKYVKSALWAPSLPLICFKGLINQNETYAGSALAATYLLAVALVPTLPTRLFERPVRFFVGFFWPESEFTVTMSRFFCLLTVVDISYQCFVCLWLCFACRLLIAIAI